MPANRFFIKEFHPLPLIIKGEELHHLRVMRIRPQDTIEIVNGNGEIANVCVEQIDKNQAILKMLLHKKIPPSEQNLILAQALPRFSSLEWIIEKGTELGTTEFWLFSGEFSEKKNLSSTQLHRLNTIVISALKQCGRLYLPKITLRPKIKEWGKISGSIFFGSPASAKTLQPPFSNPTVLCIGPEKGFSTNEIDALQKMEAKAISLSENILRSETAAIAVLSQFSLYLLN